MDQFIKWKNDNYKALSDKYIMSNYSDFLSFARGIYKSDKND